MWLSSGSYVLCYGDDDCSCLLFLRASPPQVKRALNLVQMMRSEGIAPTEITYNVVLRLCGLGGCWAMGLELMGMMEVNASIASGRFHDETGFLGNVE